MSSIREAHRKAMEAKQTIFKAQDYMSVAWNLPGPQKLMRSMDRRLAKVRAELEALDREARQYLEIVEPLGSIPKT